MTDGKLDILVNNAGLLNQTPAADIDLQQARTLFETNILGVMAMCKAFIPLLIPARGLILQISSISSIVPLPSASVYAATKTALNNYSRCLRFELRPYHVRVMVVVTGFVQSRIVDNAAPCSLPPSSLYSPLQPSFSNIRHHIQTLPAPDTHVYAANVVARAIRGESWLGGWLGGTPDIYWAGLYARKVYFLHWLPNSWIESLAYGLLGIPKTIDVAAQATT